MKKLLYRLWSRFLTIFGNIRVFKWPLWIVYDPTCFKVTGEYAQKIQEIIQPGDVILRGYDQFLDSYFINGDYSHAGIYIGNGQVIHAVSPNVSKIHILDFIACDRIAVCRPVKYSRKAIKRAKDFLNSKVPYDFGFKSKDINALYCFELAAECYRELDIPLFNISKFLGLIKKTVYLSASFKKSPDFKTVFEYNLKRDVKFGC